MEIHLGLLDHHIAVIILSQDRDVIDALQTYIYYELDQDILESSYFLISYFISISLKAEECRLFDGFCSADPTCYHLRSPSLLSN